MTPFRLQDLVNEQGAQFITIHETVEIVEKSHIDLKGTTITSTADPVFRIGGRHWAVRNGNIVATNGVAFYVKNSGMGCLRDLFVVGRRRERELFVCEGTAQCYDTHISGGEWYMPQGQRVPHVRVEVPGAFFNNNSLSYLRMQTNGKPEAPCIKLTCLHPTNWLYGNTFRQINFEIPNAGAIHLDSCFGTTIDACQMFDTHAFGPITGTLIKVGRHSSSHLRSRHTVIQQYMRPGGSLPEGLYDIDVGSDIHTHDVLALTSVGGTGKLVIRLPQSSLEQHRVLRAELVFA
jgi:hypothetical protein